MAKMKKEEKNELLNAEKLKLISFQSVKGFKKEEIETIINELIKAYNVINYENYGEEIKIKVNNFTLKTEYKKENILNCLLRFKAKIKDAEKEEKNETFEKLKNLTYGSIYETVDAYSDGHIAILKEYLGNIPTEEKEHTIKIKDNKPLTSFLTDELIKLDNFNISKNIKDKRRKYKYFVIYRNNTNYFVFNQKYVDFFKKDYVFYLDNENKNMLYAFKENKLVGVIMAMNNNFIKYDDFELLPEIENNEKDEIIRKEEILNSYEIPEKIVKIKQKNAVTEHVYSGNNEKELEKAGFKSPLWVGKQQAKKLKKQVKKDAKGVVIKVYYTDDDGRQFCKLETVYNIEELEELKKIENTNDYKNMIERLKKAV